MKILAVNEGHNASCVYMADGDIKFALQEERLSREKNKAGFPHMAVRYLADNEGVDLGGIDSFIFASNYIPASESTREERITGYKRDSILDPLKRVAKKMGAKKIRANMHKKHRLHQAMDYGISAEKTFFYDHHMCHAASAYYGLGNFEEDVLVLTNDGAGDDICATVSIGSNGGLRCISEVHMDHSIGEIWALFTAMMGMVPLEHEYKLMGLAPYSPTSGMQRVKQIFEEYFEFDESGLKWNVKRGLPPVTDAYEYFREKMEFMRFDWIAAGLQVFTEEILCQWVRNAITHTGIGNVALAGGTFMNVKANKCINEMPEVDKLYIFPSCGDETLPFGAVYHRYAQLGQLNSPLSHLYLGTQYSNAEVKDAYDSVALKHKYKLHKAKSIETEIAGLLCQGQVVAWFQGREEFGARALGARSIIADPTKGNVINEINDMIKSRDFWMPFACSMLQEGADRYLINPKNTPSPYMILTFDTTLVGEEIEGGRHPYDRTCRPQILNKELNTRYHNLLSEFKKRTGRLGILNTSLNLHGLPIASAPKDAFHVLDNSGLKYLAIEDWLIEKTE